MLWASLVSWRSASGVFSQPRQSPICGTDLRTATSCSKVSFENCVEQRMKSRHSRCSILSIKEHLQGPVALAMKIDRLAIGILMPTYDFVLTAALRVFDLTHIGWCDHVKRCAKLARRVSFLLYQRSSLCFKRILRGITVSGVPHKTT